MGSNWSGRTVVITGGAHGIGRSTADHLATRGANVAIADVDLPTDGADDEDDRSVVEESIGGDGEIVHVRTNVTDPDQTRGLASAVNDRFGSIDVLVANAGGGDGPIDGTFASELDLDDLHATVERNLYGTIYSCLAVAPYMKAQGSGSIVTMASRAGRRATDTGSYAHYGAAKAGVIMYTKYLAQDLGEYGITVNALAPGPIGTERLQEDVYDEETIAAIEADVPVRRFGEPAECAAAITFLAGDDARFVNGAVLPIDGGVVRGL